MIETTIIKYIYISQLDVKNGKIYIYISIFIAKVENMLEKGSQEENDITARTLHNMYGHKGESQVV